MNKEKINSSKQRAKTDFVATGDSMLNSISAKELAKSHRVTVEILPY